MYSIISSAVLATAVFGQAVIGASLGHSHAHLHHKKAPAEVEEKRDLLTDAAQALSSVFSEIVATTQILTAANAAYAEGTAIGLGGSGPFQVEFVNKGTEPLVLVIWSGHDQWSSIEAMAVRVSPANVTHALAAGASQIVSFDPDCHEGKQISGAFSAIYQSTAAEGISYAGQVNNTWGEFTFETNDAFSTLDVSRLINMAGNDMTIQTYPSAGGELACTATMNECAYVCAEGVNTCPGGSMASCSGSGTTAGNWGFDGGCAGMTQTGGYVVVTFT